MSRASDRAYSHIRSMILSGELQPGSQIREEALAELCGVSRTPVRDALRRLEAELFIRRNESQRSFVADWSLDDLEEAFQLRAMLEAMPLDAQQSGFRGISSRGCAVTMTRSGRR